MRFFSGSQAYIYSVVGNRGSRWSRVGAVRCENNISAWWARV